MTGSIISQGKAQEGPIWERTRIGIDLAKNCFHLVAMDSRGKILWRKALTRRRVLEFLIQVKPGLGAPRGRKST
jgi:hypothetical protein